MNLSPYPSFRKSPPNDFQKMYIFTLEILLNNSHLDNGSFYYKIVDKQAKLKKFGNFFLKL